MRESVGERDREEAEVLRTNRIKVQVKDGFGSSMSIIPEGRSVSRLQASWDGRQSNTLSQKQNETK